MGYNRILGYPARLVTFYCVTLLLCPALTDYLQFFKLITVADLHDFGFAAFHGVSWIIWIHLTQCFLTIEEAFLQEIFSDLQFFPPCFPFMGASFSIFIE